MNDRQLVKYQILHAETLLPVMRYDQYDGQYHEWFCYSVEDATQGLEFVIEEWQDDDFLVALVLHPPADHIYVDGYGDFWSCNCCGAMAEIRIRIRHYPDCNPVEFDKINSYFEQIGCGDPECGVCRD